MSFSLAPVLKQRFFDQNGAPLAGGQLFSFVAGTNIFQATYTDGTGTTPNTNPVILDANGYAPVWLDDSGTYKFILEDVNSVTQFTVDNVKTGNGSGTSLGAAQVQTLFDNQVTPTNINGLKLDFTVNQMVEVDYTIIRSNGTVWRREQGALKLAYDAVNGWRLQRSSNFDDALNSGQSLTITNAGQVQYLSDSMGGTYAGKISWRISFAYAQEGI